MGTLTRIYETSTKQNGAGIVNREGKDVERRPASDLSVWEGAGNAVKKRSLAISAFECPWAVPRLLLVGLGHTPPLRARNGYRQRSCVATAHWRDDETDCARRWPSTARVQFDIVRRISFSNVPFRFCS